MSEYTTVWFVAVTLGFFIGLFVGLLLTKGETPLERWQRDQLRLMRQQVWDLEIRLASVRSKR